MENKWMFFSLYVSIYLVVFLFCRCFVVFKGYFLALLCSLCMNWWNCTKNFSKAVLSSCVLWTQKTQWQANYNREKMFGRNHFGLVYSCCQFVEAFFQVLRRHTKQIDKTHMNTADNVERKVGTHSFLTWSNLFIFIWVSMDSIRSRCIFFSYFFS